ncbi:hypothetical protein POTOM_034776 [Populus tomentosa]|uniref:Uncharacterized protein n=1 Tax=Populus tomentosa TaxID=118781 RepID=A0A8X7YZA8_POPTO|nr:hypothetical protein POTOM_034776 [Populus tomentosa]
MFKAYFVLFENDFMVSLKSRSEEMIPGGHMVLTVIGSATRNILMTLFNLPHCAAPAEEARHIIKKEGSLNIERFTVFQVDWDSCMGNDLRFDKQAREKYITMSIRVLVIESSLDSNLAGRSWRFARKVVEHSEGEKGEC